jgi:superfamily I DNA/RNA helicase
MLGHDDFAILREYPSTGPTELNDAQDVLLPTVRYNALSRPIELELQKQHIPSRLIGGHKFFERVEVKDLLAYLQLVDNPNYYVRIDMASLGGRTD